MFQVSTGRFFLSLLLLLKLFSFSSKAFAQTEPRPVEEYVTELISPALWHPESLSIQTHLSPQTLNDITCPRTTIQLWVHDNDRPTIGDPWFLVHLQTLTQIYIKKTTIMIPECSERMLIRFVMMTGFEDRSQSAKPIKLNPKISLEKSLANALTPLLFDPDHFDVLVGYQCAQNEQEFGCTYVRGSLRFAEADDSFSKNRLVMQALYALFFEYVRHVGLPIIGKKNIFSYPAIILETLP